ncbi:MAG: NAD(P)H-dependent glycerol-3-phosphate dehydrogenase [Oscillospiraceae bacterium]
MAKISILGSGGFGIALAVHSHRCGHDITVWSAFGEEIEAIKRDGEHKKLLPGVPVSEKIRLTTELSDITDSDMVIFAVPAKVLREVARKAAPFIGSEAVIVNVGKGIEDETYKRLSEVLSEENPGKKLAILSGPSHAEEVALEMPTVVLAASDNYETAEYVQKTLINENFRIYVSNDIVGCELGGALKNAIALCAGISDGLGYGDNAKAALMTRGIAEISRLGSAMGAKDSTFMGLSGIGDLIVTCTSMHSRNRRAGILIGQGVAPDEAVRQVGTVEGYFCCKVAYKLAKKLGVDMPIINKLHGILFEGAEIGTAASDLMGRPMRRENR